MLFKDFSGKPEEDGGYIVAYASTFDRDVDLHGDVIAKGAFADSLADWEASGKPIPLCFNHQFDDPTYNIGYVVEAVEDDHGLLIKAAFDPENEKAQYVRKLVQEGRMWKMSFGSIVQDARQTELEDGTICREITKSKILEVSIVQIPANEHAEILVVKNGESATGMKTGKLHVITGAPCSGKSTYVREHRQSGDVVIDYDVLAQALGSDDPHRAPESIRRAAFAARRGAIESVLNSGAEAWVIHTTPTNRDIQKYQGACADFVTLDTDLETCLQRAKDDERPEGTETAIYEWFGTDKPETDEDADTALAPEAEMLAEKAADRDHGNERAGAWKRVRREAFERDKANKAPCAICGKPINYERGMSTRGGESYDPLAYEASHKRNIREHPELELELDNIQASHAGCNRGDTHNGDRADSKISVSKAYTEALLKAINGFSQSLTLRLTDAQGNVVSEIPLTAEFVASELESISDQPGDGSESISEEIQLQQEGDSSSVQAADGETGALGTDEDLLAQIQQVLNQGE